jgi:hypothetical protein
MRSMAFFHVHIYIYVRERDTIADIKSGLPFFFDCYSVYILYVYIGIKREERKIVPRAKNERDDTSYSLTNKKNTKKEDQNAV